MDETLTSGNTLSPWHADVKTLDSLPLTTDKNTEVCIIGGGITGLTAAYCLLKAGKKVILLEDGKIGSGETSRTTAHLSNALDDRYINIEKIHGKKQAMLAAQSHSAAINFIATIVEQEKIDCDFLRLNGYLFADPSTSVNFLYDEYQAAKRAGIEVSFLEAGSIKNPDIGAAVVFHHQAQFHPLKYLQALATIVYKLGGEIFETTHVESINRKGKLSIIKTANNTVSANAVIQATNVPINTQATFHSKQLPNRSYVIAAAIPANAIETALYWDTADPYHYIRLQKNHSVLSAFSTPHYLLIIGGEDHRTGCKPVIMPFIALEKWARNYFPAMTEVLYRWSGQIIEPIDYLSFIGENYQNDNSYFVTGDSGNGMTHGTLAGIMLSELILSKTNRWEKMYTPSRFACRPLADFFANNMAVIKSYLRYFMPTVSDSATNLLPGQGKILGYGWQKKAVYRNLEGKLETFSAVCPHLKALLNWNAIENTWDCPAHGSRFLATGEVINGPANCPLTKINSENTNIDKK